MKSIQDAIRDKKEMFLFEGVKIKITPTVGLFITMNPGYAGRTELPENLKALFRWTSWTRVLFVVVVVVVVVLILYCAQLVQFISIKKKALSKIHLQCTYMYMYAVGLL